MNDGDSFRFGEVDFNILHVPGHTLGHVAFYSKKAGVVFTGDTLFLGDVGRPDLSQNSNLSNRNLASMLFDSLRNKIMTLNDDVIIYPGHGEGSSCGKDLSSETIGTLGDQKKTNYALRENMTKDEFIRDVLNGLLDPPKYFPDNVMLNKKGYDESDEIIERSFNALTPSKVESRLKEKITILDVRSVENFSSSHIPGSIFIGLDGRFAPWVGAVFSDIDQQILLVVDENRIDEAITRLSRVGFDNVKGYLKGGVLSWQNAGKAIEKVNNIKNDIIKDKNKQSRIISSELNYKKKIEFGKKEFRYCELLQGSMDDLDKGIRPNTVLNNFAIVSSKL